MQPIATHLWFDTHATEAAEFYASVFPNSRVTSTTQLRDTPVGDTDVVTFELGGRPFMAISAGPLFKFNPSVSFQVRLATKAAVDAAWTRLATGGSVRMPLQRYPFNERFGWLEDRFGLSWQLMLAGAEDARRIMTPALMFTGRVAGKAEEAIGRYTAVFKAPAPVILARYGANDGPDAEGTVRQASFTLAGQPFCAMDSALPHDFTFNEAISIVVPCDTQDEIDYYWRELSADPKAEQCGWLKDRYGLSWQITPAILGRLLSSGDGERTGRVTRAFLAMKKFDIAALERAYDG